MSKFKVGDKVKYNEGGDVYTGYFAGNSNSRRRRPCMELDSESIKGGSWRRDCEVQSSYVSTGVNLYKFIFDMERLELIESSNKTKNMSVKSKIKQIMRSEPEKTFVEVGFLDDNENITEDGRAILEQILWDANKDKLKELADKVLESEAK